MVLFRGFFSGNKERKKLYIFLIIISMLMAVSIYASGFADSLIENSRLGASHTSFSLGDTVFREANNPGIDPVDIERRLETQVAIDSFLQNPVFGAGYMSTPYYMGLLTQYETVAHGLPSGILGELGTIGALLFLLICALSVKGYLNRARGKGVTEAKWIYLELVTFSAALLAGLFHQANHDFYLYLFAGIGLLGRRQARSVSATTQ